MENDHLIVRDLITKATADCTDAIYRSISLLEPSSNGPVDQLELIEAVCLSLASKSFSMMRIVAGEKISVDEYIERHSEFLREMIDANLKRTDEIHSAINELAREHESDGVDMTPEEMVNKLAERVGGDGLRRK